MAADSVRSDGFNSQLGLFSSIIRSIISIPLLDLQSFESMQSSLMSRTKTSNTIAAAA